MIRNYFVVAATIASLAACSSGNAFDELARTGCQTMQASSRADATKAANAGDLWTQFHTQLDNAVKAGADPRLGQGLTQKAEACKELYGVDVYG